MKVAKWGSSLAVRLPATMVAAFGLKPGDEIEFYVERMKHSGAAKLPDRRDLLASIRKHRGRLPRDFKLDPRPR